MKLLKINCLIYIALFVFTSGILAEQIDINLSGQKSKYNVSWSFENLTQIEKYTPYSSTSQYEGSNAVSIRLKSEYYLNNNIKLKLHAQEEIYSYTDNIEGFDKNIYFKKNIPNYRRFNLSKIQIEKDNILVKSEIDFINIAFTYDKIDLILGRQPISYGQTSFWNPIDWLSSVELGYDDKNKIICIGDICIVGGGFLPGNIIENEYKSGIDAVRGFYKKSDLSGMEFVYATGKEGSVFEHAEIIRAYSIFEDFDLEVMLGNFKNDRRIGCGLNAEIKKLKLKSEISHVISDINNEDDFTMATIGAVYKYSDNLEINTEFYYNGFGAETTDNYIKTAEKERISSGEINNIGKYYFALAPNYKINSILKSELLFVLNLIDNSNIIAPKIVYSISNNSEFSGGVLISSGKRSDITEINSEYGKCQDIYFIKYKVYF